MVRAVGILLLVIGATYLRGGLFPGPMSASADDYERGALHERRSTAIGFGVLSIIAGVVLIAWPTRNQPIQAVSLDRWFDIQISEDAAAFATHRLAELASPPGSGIRIVAGQKPREFELKFDVPHDDTDDFVGESRGIAVFVHSSIRPMIEGKSIGLVNGHLVLADS